MTFKELYFLGFIDVEDYDLAKILEDDIYPDEDIEDITNNYYDQYLEDMRP